MDKKKMLLYVQAALCILWAALMAAAAVHIYSDGLAYRAQGHPEAWIYTREKAAAAIGRYLPLLLLARKAFGRRFLLETAAAIAVCSLSADYFSEIEPPLKDPLLAAVFGGALMGAGCGAVFLSGATTGGTDIAAKLILKRRPHFSTGRVFLVIDGSVCIAAGIVFKSITTALYAFIGLFTFSKVLDAVLYGGNKAKLVLIVTKKTDELLSLLLGSANVGCTVISVREGFSGTQASTLMCAMKKHRLHSVRRLTMQTDDQAFMLVLDTNEVYGTGFQSIDIGK